MEAAFTELIKKLKSIHYSEHPDLRAEIRNDWEPIRSYLVGEYEDDVNLDNEILVELTEAVDAFREDKNFNQRLEMADREIDRWINEGNVAGGRRRRRVRRKTNKKRRANAKCRRTQHRR